MNEENAFLCNLCPRRCGAKRGEYEGAGFCRQGTLPRLARCAKHFDEEPVISGESGSGAIFFSGCTLGCVYCQNYEISHGGFGRSVSIRRLREICFELIDRAQITSISSAVHRSCPPSSTHSGAACLCRSSGIPAVTSAQRHFGHWKKLLTFTCRTLNIWMRRLRKD